MRVWVELREFICSIHSIAFLPPLVTLIKSLSSWKSFWRDENFPMDEPNTYTRLWKRCTVLSQPQVHTLRTRFCVRHVYIQTWWFDHHHYHFPSLPDNGSQCRQNPDNQLTEGLLQLLEEVSIEQQGQWEACLQSDGSIDFRLCVCVCLDSFPSLPTLL